MRRCQRLYVQPYGEYNFNVETKCILNIWRHATSPSLYESSDWKWFGIFQLSKYTVSAQKHFKQQARQTVFTFRAKPCGLIHSSAFVNSFSLCSEIYVYHFITCHFLYLKFI